MHGSNNPTDPILVIDDEASALDSVRITLETEGYSNLVLCSDSREVGGMLAARTFSLVLLDLHMPHVTGNEIIKLIAGRHAAPVVVVTASERFADYLDGVAGEVSDFLVKPIDRRALVAAVRNALEGGREGPRRRLSRDYLLCRRIHDASEVAASMDARGMSVLLTQVRREYRRLLNELPTPYVVMEAGTWCIRFSNAAFRQFLASVGKAHADVACFLDLFDGPSRELLHASISERGALTGVELRGRVADREFALAGTFHVNRADGYVEGGFVDVTERTRLRESLAQAERMEAIGRLAGGFAHDLNNLLLVIGGFAGLLLAEQGLPAPAVEAAAEIASAVASGGTLVRRMLAPDAEAEPRRRIALHEALRDAASGLRLLLPGSCVLQLDLQAADPVIEAGPTLVARVLHNLVINARDAMPRGGTITVSTSDRCRGPDERAAIALEVRDTGCGMDDTTKARIFEPFFTTKDRGKGSGFGLPTIRRLLAAVGGTIEVESAQGEGTVFRLGLPRAGDG